VGWRGVATSITPQTEGKSLFKKKEEKAQNASAKKGLFSLTLCALFNDCGYNQI